MIATLTARGVLELRPETELESYALHRWAGDAQRTGLGYEIRIVIDGKNGELLPYDLTAQPHQ